ncbi:MAG: hypothetical protein GY906_16830 [bacterium]|nr:hypothetical protein [bacterium]
MPPANFVPESATKFFLPDQGWELEFKIGPNGLAETVRFSMQGGRIQMEAVRVR